MKRDIIFDTDKEGQVYRIRKPLDDGRFLCIEVDYSKGGYNYWSGVHQPRGYRLDFTVKKFDNGATIYTPANPENFRVLVKEAGRFAKGTLKKLRKRMFENSTALIEAYQNRDYDRIMEIFE